VVDAEAKPAKNKKKVIVAGAGGVGSFGCPYREKGTTGKGVQESEQATLQSKDKKRTKTAGH